jgi:hypothetical protein
MLGHSSPSVRVGKHRAAGKVRNSEVFPRGQAPIQNLVSGELDLSGAIDEDTQSVQGEITVGYMRPCEIKSVTSVSPNFLAPGQEKSSLPPMKATSTRGIHTPKTVLLSRAPRPLNGLQACVIREAQQKLPGLFFDANKLQDFRWQLLLRDATPRQG